MFATGIVMLQWLLLARQSHQTGWDFPVFYIAGSLPIHHLYDHAAFEAFWADHLAPLGVPHWAPYVRLSAFSFLLRPIARLPYYEASWIWMGVGLSAYFASIGLLMHDFRLPGFLLPAYAAFFPGVVGIISGSDAGFLLLAVVVALILLKRKRERLAAIALTACLCKFNLILLVPFLLLLQRRYKVLTYFVIGCGFIAGISLWLTPVREYFGAIRDAQNTTAGFFPVGLRGFSVAIGQPWSYPVLAVAAFMLCCWLMKRLPMPEAFCVAILGSILISPYVCWYDSTLLALPIAVVFARSTTSVRLACGAVLAAIPLWEHGGGNNGPIGFMHVGVEVSLLMTFVDRTWLSSRLSEFRLIRGKAAA